jgi:L-amino acid N-acyltransferase YncA
MKLSSQAVSIADICLWRDLYRQEMNCQIIHDSLHRREGWTQPYLLELDGAAAGYGSIVLAGPWKGTRTVFEFYAAPKHRSQLLDLFDTFLAASAATAINAQTNDALLSVMLYAYGRDIKSEKIVFQDKLTTNHILEGVTLRRRESEEDWVLEAEGEAAGKGGILYHYNRPYGDIFMEVAAPFRRRGFGCYIVQELKRVCYEQGSIPCARCDTQNLASRKTLQKAGFVPCAHILTGTL